MGKDAVPYYCKKGKFSPICGHGFWNNHFGADAFCQALGFTCGTSTKYRGKYEQDAIMIGTCNPFDAIDQCTGGNNSYSLDEKHNCRFGNNVKVLVACEGNTSGSEMNSGSGKIGKL